MSALTTAADDLWRYSLEPQYEVQRIERLFADAGIRLAAQKPFQEGFPNLRSCMYANLDILEKNYFGGEGGPGFSMISVSVGAAVQASTTKKRPNNTNFKFLGGNKRQRGNA